MSSHPLISDEMTIRGKVREVKVWRSQKLLVIRRGRDTGIDGQQGRDRERYKKGR